MQGKRLVTFLLLSLAITLSWLWINTKLKEKHPDWYLDQPATEPTTQNQTPSTSPTTQPASTQPTGIYPVGGDAKTIDIGSNKFDPQGVLSTYPLGLSLDPQGASIS